MHRTIRIYVIDEKSDDWNIAEGKCSANKGTRTVRLRPPNDGSFAHEVLRTEGSEPQKALYRFKTPDMKYRLISCRTDNVCNYKDSSRENTLYRFILRYEVSMIDKLQNRLCM